MPDLVADYLRSVQTPDAIKAQAWDAVHESKSDAELTERLRRLPVGNDVRAQLFDLYPHAATSVPVEPLPMPAAASAGMPGQSRVGVLDPGSDRRSPVERFREDYAPNIAKEQREKAQGGSDLARGVGAGAMSTVVHGGDLVRWATNQERVINDPSVQKLITPPDSAAGKVGFYGEQMAEFALPALKVEKATKVLPAAARIAADVATGTAVAGIQSGGDPGTMAAAGTLTALGPVAGRVVRGGVNAVTRAAAGAREGGVGGAVAAVVRNVAPPAPRAMLVQALKPRNVKIYFEGSLDRAMPELKAAEARLGKPIASIDDVLEATKIAKAGIQEQLGVARAGAQGFHVDGSPVADAMMQAIPNKLRLENPNAVAQLEAAANAYRRTFTLEETETLLRETNAELNGLYQQLPGGQYRALATNPGVMQLNAQAKTFRTSIDNTLDRWAEGAGPAAQELRKRYGSLLDVEDVAYRRVNVAKRQQPDSLAEQIGAMHAAGDWARGLYKIARSIPTLSPRMAAEGAADIASGAAKRQMSQFMKENQTSDALIRRAFEVYRQLPEPVVMPSRAPVRGFLGRGPVVTPPPGAGDAAIPGADRSFARGVQGEYATREPRGFLGPARPTGTPPPPSSGRVFQMPGDVQADPSKVGSVPAQPLAYEINPGVPVKAGGVRVSQFAGDPEAARAAIATPEVRNMLERMLADLNTFEPVHGRMIRSEGSAIRDTYSYGAAGSPVAEDIAVISEQHVSNQEIKRAIDDLLQGEMPTNRLHTAALDAAMGYLERRSGYRGPSIPAELVEPSAQRASSASRSAQATYENLMKRAAKLRGHSDQSDEYRALMQKASKLRAKMRPTGE